MRMAMLGHDVIAVDNYYKVKLMKQENLHPLRKIPLMHQRVSDFEEVSGRQMEYGLVNVNSDIIIGYIKELQPDVIIHYAEQPSAPYSMIDRNTCIDTYINNVVGTLNILWAIRGTDTHLIKLGTMGEYGTPSIHIPEGWLEVDGSKLPFPKLPGSFYHASKVADSVNLEFACRAWDVRCTDLNQGIVYGSSTKETRLHDHLFTAFYYDAVFGTALNRFIAQAVCEKPITVYGKGGQTRGWLHIEDTLQCVEIAMNNPPKPGEFKVRNQFTEIFSVMEIAEKVKAALGGEIQYVINPRVEKEKHFYSASNQSFLDQGLKPRLLALDEIVKIANEVAHYKEHVRTNDLFIRVDWK
jgi:UDP-sulfoquinovose synthase